MLNLEEHLLAGGDPPNMKQLEDGQWVDPVDGWSGPAFLFDYVGDRDGVEGEWRGENRRSMEMRAAIAFGRALAGEPALPWDVARRNAILAKWPQHRQLEVLTDVAMGRPGAEEMLQQMRDDFAAIKTLHPKPGV